MSRRFPFPALLALTLLALAIAPARAEARPPNVVIVFADDLGYGDIGCFGAKGYATPNLDRLASQGRRFTNFHVGQAICSASRAALLTGCYPNRIGVHGALGTSAKHGIADGETTLAELFRSRGYATGMAGKWHLGHLPPFLPTRHGFDEYFGLPYSNDMWPLNPEAKPPFPPLHFVEGDRALPAEVTPDDQATLTARYTESAVSFIERNKDRPFFFYLAHSMCHVPLYTSPPYRGKTERGVFGDVIEEIDGSVGAVMKALADNGLERDTLVIFTSDNGPWLNYGDHAGSAGPLREGKGTSWEGGIRVPCVMRWPGVLEAGTTSDACLMTIDLLPTFARVIGASLPAHKIDGLDVGPLLRGEPGATNPHDAYFIYYETGQLQAVVSGDGHWKLILPHDYRSLNGRPGGKGGVPVRYDRNTVKRPELYELAADPGETRDRAPEHPEIVARLLAEADKARADLGDSLTGRTGTGLRPAGRVAP